MRQVLLAYATRQGSTRRVAEHLAERLRTHGIASTLLDVRSVPTGFDPRGFSSVVLVGSLHFGEHEPELRRFTVDHGEALRELPSAFLSLSMSEAMAEDPQQSEASRQDARARAQAALDSFLTETSLRPARALLVAGALYYGQHGALTRLRMDRAARRVAPDVEHHHDHEYMDWGSIDALAEALVDDLARRQRHLPTG